MATLIQNGTIITMDPGRPRAEAVLMEGDRITYVGDTAQALSRAGDNPETIDLAGRAMIPGFNDNHVHTAIGGDHAESISLRDLSADQIVEAISRAAAETPAGELITAFGWDYPACPHPHKSLLDEAAAEHPVILFQFGGHGSWVNSRALAKMKIDRNTPNPPEGTILHDDCGEPTGILREMDDNPYLRKKFVAMQNHGPTVHRSVGHMLVEYRRLGITSVQDNTWFPTVFWDLIKRRNTGELTTRFTSWLYGEVPAVMKPMEWLLKTVRFDDLWVRKGPYKYFLDGTFSTRSAWLTAPYADEAGNSGKGRSAEAIAAGFLDKRLSRHQSVACHAIGDRAVKEFLDALESLQKAYPWSRDMRLRLEHAQLIRPEDIPRLRKLGVLISAQPHAMGTPEKDRELLGEERAAQAYPYRWLLDEGVALSFGSDFPGEPTLDPLHAIRLMTEREGPQAITVEEALHGYTAASAYAEGTEDAKGSISAGKLADLVVLSANPLGGLDGVTVDMTFCAGRVVFDRSTPRGVIEC